MATLETMELDVVSAEAAIFKGAVSHVVITGADGELGIFPGHTALLTSVKPGQIRAKSPQGDEEIFYISGGMLEVQPDSVTILADTAARASDLDEAAAMAAKEQAERLLKDKSSGLEYSKALIELAQAAAKLRAIQLTRSSGRG